MNELQVATCASPRPSRASPTIQTGPANRPYGQFIPSPLGLGYADTKVIETYRMMEAMAKGESISPNIGDVVEVARLTDAVQRGGWVDIGGRPALTPSVKRSAGACLPLFPALWATFPTSPSLNRLHGNAR